MPFSRRTGQSRKGHGSVNRHSLIGALSLARARTATDALFGMVRPEAFYDRPVSERHRTIFYFGHLEAFDWNLLGESWVGSVLIEAQPRPIIRSLRIRPGCWKRGRR